MTIKKAGREITTLDDWEAYAGPKSADQWRDGRSAKEAARAWLEGDGQIPPEIRAALASHPAFAGIPRAISTAGHAFIRGYNEPVHRQGEQKHPPRIASINVSLLTRSSEVPSYQCKWPI